MCSLSPNPRALSTLALCVVSMLAILTAPAIVRAQALFGAGDAATRRASRPSVLVLGPLPLIERLDRPGTLGPRGGARVAEAFTRGVAHAVAVHTQDITPTPRRALEARLRAERLFNARLAEARAAARQGVRAFKELNAPGAITSLERARELYERNLLELLYPAEAAEILLYLSLSYLERGDEIFSASQRLQDLVMLAPDQPLRAGLYPEAVVKTYTSARRALVRTLYEQGPRLRELERARRAAAAAGVDYVMYGMIVPDEGGRLVARVQLYSARRDELLKAEQIPLERPSRVSARDAGELLAGRLIACLRQPEPGDEAPVAPSRGTSPMSLSVLMSYGAFMKYPDKFGRPFGNVGLDVGARWALTEEFGLVAHAQLLIARPDYNANIITEDFSTLRGFVGGELGLRFNKFRMALQIAGDLTRVSDFEGWGDESCVPRVGTPEACGADLRQRYALGWMIGLNARPVLSFRLLPSIEAVATGSASYFFIQEDSRMNFPLNGELGLRYRF